MDANDLALYDYMIQMGQMTPQMEKLKRQQTMVDALRMGSMKQQDPTAMAGNVVAPTGLGNMLGSLAQGYGAMKGQEKLNTEYANANAQQAAALEQWRRKMKGLTGDGTLDTTNTSPQAGY